MSAPATFDQLLSVFIPADEPPGSLKRRALFDLVTRLVAAERASHKLPWTASPPTEPGAYWYGTAFMCRMSGDPTMRIHVEVYRDDDGTLCARTQEAPYKDNPIAAYAERPGSRWAGPLPEPEGRT